MIWALQPQPGNHHLAVFCDDLQEWVDVVWAARRGLLTFDGQQALLHWPDCDFDAYFLRFWLPEPFRMPPLVLHFEDIPTAVRIEEQGWYAFEGATHRVMGREGGSVSLDRVYVASPTPMYHGRQLVEPSPDSAVSC